MAHLPSGCPLTGRWSSPVGHAGLTGVQEAARPVTRPESVVTETTEAPRARPREGLGWSQRGGAWPSGCQEPRSSAGSSKSEKKNAHT